MRCGRIESFFLYERPGPNGGYPVPPIATRWLLRFHQPPLAASLSATTPYGPNWVTPDFSFVRRTASIISLHTVVNSKVPWDIFLGDYRSLAEYDADLKRDAPAWRNTLCALRSQSYPRPIYLSEEFLLDRGKGPHILPPRLDGTYPAEFLIGGISTYRS